MANTIRFTDQMDMRLLTHFGDCWILQLALPMFVWLQLPWKKLLDNEIQPLFYVSNNYALPSVASYHLLRGATEAVCEDAWETYRDLIDNGISEPLVRRILPATLMSQGSVTLTTSELLVFIEQHRESPTTELAALAHGCERAFHGDRNTGNRDPDGQVSGDRHPGGQPG